MEMKYFEEWRNGSKMWADILLRIKKTMVKGVFEVEYPEAGIDILAPMIASSAELREVAEAGLIISYAQQGPEAIKALTMDLCLKSLSLYDELNKDGKIDKALASRS